MRGAVAAAPRCGELFLPLLFGKLVGALTIITSTILVAFPVTIIGNVVTTMYDRDSKATSERQLRRDFANGIQPTPPSDGLDAEDRGPAWGQRGNTPRATSRIFDAMHPHGESAAA
eukprot:gene31054-38023_t